MPFGSRLHQNTHSASLQDQLAVHTPLTLKEKKINVQDPPNISQRQTIMCELDLSLQLAIDSVQPVIDYDCLHMETCVLVSPRNRTQLFEVSFVILNTVGKTLKG